MPESKKTRRPTEAEASLALRERILELQASNTPLSDAEKAKVAQRDQGCPDVGREPHDQRVLARTELGLPPHVEEDLAALDPCHADRVHEDVVAWTIRSRVEQGLPSHIEDPVVLDMVPGCCWRQSSALGQAHASKMAQAMSRLLLPYRWEGRPSLVLEAPIGAAC